MRINKYIAQSTGLSRRAADSAINEGRVTVNGKIAVAGYDVLLDDVVTLDNVAITPDVNTVTILMNKPVGYVVSRKGQGSHTIYDILPPEYYHLKPVGRLDKDSSGLLLLTNDGQLAQNLTHPSHQKTKVYEVELDKPLQPLHQQMISDHGLQLEDGKSQFLVTKIDSPVHSTGAPRSGAGEERAEASEAMLHPRRGEPLLNHENRRAKQAEERIVYQITMHEGRNRQIRRTFAALGYTVTKLHRTHFGSYQLGNLAPGATKNLP